MLMKRRSSPLSSTNRSLRPGNWRSRSATTSSTVPAFVCTSALPFVTCRSGVGIRTVTGILVSFVFRSPRTVGPQPHEIQRPHCLLLSLAVSFRLVLEVGERAIERRQRRFDLHVGLEPIVERIRRLEAIAGDAHHHRLVARDHTCLDELFRGGERHTAGRLGEDPFCPRQQQHGFDDFGVGGVLAEAARLLRGSVRVVAVGGITDGQRLGNRVRAHRLQHIGIVPDHRDDWPAAQRLRGVHLGPNRPVQQIEALQLLDGFPDLRDQRAARARHDDVVRCAPAQLFDDFESVRLRSFRVVRPKIHVHERPAVLVRDLRAQAVDLVVRPVNGDQRGIVDQRREHLALLEIGRDEDIGLQPSLGRVSRHGVGQVSCRRTRDGVEPELARLRHRHRDDAILERPRGMADGVVLDPDLATAQLVGQVPRPDQRREAHVVAHRHVTLDRQQVLVAPHARRPRGDRCACDDALERLVLVVDFEWAETELADVNGGGGIVTATLPTLPPLQLRHGLSIGRGIEPRVLQHRQQEISATKAYPAGNTRRYARFVLPLVLLLGFGIAFAGATLGGAMLGFDDHPGQLYRVWHVLTYGPAPWAWDRGWWAGYPELQFYPPGFAYVGALLAWATAGVFDIRTVYQGLLWLAYLLPGVTTYVALTRLTGRRWMALPFSFVALTLSAGFASGVNGGVRTGMVGARLAWALLPILLTLLVRWIEERRPLSPAVALLLAVVTLLHPAQLPAAAALIALAIGFRAPWWPSAREALKALGLAAALTGFWTLPLLFRLAETRALAWGALSLADVMRPLPIVLLGLAIAGVIE